MSAINIIMVAFTALALFLLPSFYHLAPYLSDAVFRVRGSEALEFSVSVSRERNTIAYVLLIPFVLILSRYHIYEPSFIAQLQGGWHILACFGAFVVYCSLRILMYLLLRPRRHYENFRLAHRAVYTFFILYMLVALPALGILTVFDANDLVIKTVMLILLSLFYALFLVRKTQILLLSCGGLRTFSYLCALEIFPTALMIVSAVVL